MFSVAAFAAGAFAVGTWEEYRPVSFEGVGTIGDVAFNEAGTGFAASSTLSGSRRGYVWKYTGGEWRTIPPPYDVIYRLTVGRNGSCYGLDGHQRIWRLTPGAQYWQIVGDAVKVGLLGYDVVVGVGRREFWAGGVRPDGHGLVVYYEQDQPRETFDIGVIDPYSGRGQILLAVPRTASPVGEAYVVALVRATVEPRGKYELSVLNPSGESMSYEVPISSAYACGGLVARAPGDVIVSFNNGDSFIFEFSNGEFKEVAYYADRCDVKAYPAPDKGWGYRSERKCTTGRPRARVRNTY